MRIEEFCRLMMRAIVVRLQERVQAGAECWTSCAMWFYSGDETNNRELKWRTELDVIRRKHGRAPWKGEEQDALRVAFTRCMIYMHKQAKKHRRSPDGEIECTEEKVRMLANWPSDDFYREWKSIWT